MFPFGASLRRTSKLPRLTFVSPPSFRSFQSHACGFFSAFAHATCSLSVCSQYLGLEFNAPVFILRIQAVLLFCGNLHKILVYEAVTLYGRSFQNARLVLWMKRRATSPPLLPKRDSVRPLRLSIALLTASLMLSSPPGTKIFQFPGYACHCWHIRKSQVQSLTCGYPGLIAACHVLRRCCSQAIP